jgi:putative ABC transport system permease protein
VLVALREMRRAKLRFGMLVAAVGFLSFLIVFQQALLGQLVDQFVGAVRQQSGDVLVYSDEARVNLQGGVVADDVVDRVAEVDGVAEVGPIGVATVTVEAAGEDADATLFGHEPDRPGGPRTTSAGRMARSPGEAVASTGSEDEGFDVGDVVRVVPGGQRLRIVGLVPDAALSVTTTLFLDLATYQEIRRAQNPDAPRATISAVAARVEDGKDPAAVARAITRAVPGTEALDRETAADRTPGVESVNQSLALIVFLSYAVILVVTGFFFLILTVQKAPSLTLLRALGAPAGTLVVGVLTQAAAVIGGGFAVGTLLALGALAASPLGSTTPDPGQVLTALAVLLVLGGLASIASVRRVLAIDPVQATTQTGAVR